MLSALLLAPAVGRAQEIKDPTLDAARKRAIVEEVSRAFNDSYVFPEAAKKVEERLRARLAKGDYDQHTGARAFAQAISADILEVTKDRHTGFRFAPEMAADMRRMQGRDQEEIRRGRERQLAEARHDNFAFRKVERLAGNVGYLDLRNFLPADVAGPTAVAALELPRQLRRGDHRPPAERGRRSDDDPAHHLVLLRGTGPPERHLDPLQQQHREFLDPSLRSRSAHGARRPLRPDQPQDFLGSRGVLVPT